MAAEVQCSFCGKEQHQVLQIIAGAKVFICNECVQFCVQIVGQGHPEWLEEHKRVVNEIEPKQPLFSNDPALSKRPADGAPS